MVSSSFAEGSARSTDQEKFRALIVEDDNVIVERGKSFESKSERSVSSKNRRRPTVDRAFPINPEALVSESFLAQEPEFLN